MMSLAKAAFTQKLPETAQITCFMMISMSVAYSASLNPVPHKPNYVTNESLEISFCQKLYGTDQTNSFIIIFMSVGHSFSLSSTTHNEYGALPAFRKLHFFIVPGNIFCKFQKSTTRIAFCP